MGLRVAPAETPAERERVYRLRYEIYVRELELLTPEADHRWRRLTDPLDEHGLSFVVWEGDEALGCLRVVLLSDLPDPVPVLRKVHALPVQLRFGSSAIATTSRFMLHSRVRQSRAVFVLMRAAFDWARARGVRFNFGDCTAHQLPFYEHLGFRSYEAGFNDPAYGFKLPLVMLVGDREGFAARRSPLARVAAAHPDDPAVREWFGRVWARSPYAETAATQGVDRLRLTLRRALGGEPASVSAVFTGLTSNEIDLLLSRATLFRVREGDRIVRRGEPAQSLLVMASGEGLPIGEAEGAPPVCPGEPFGLGDALWRGRRDATIVATGAAQALSIPGDFLDGLERRAPDVARRVVANLEDLVARRRARHWLPHTAVAAAAGS